MGPSNAEKDYYAILGAAEDVSQVEIDRIYKRLAVQHHPDRGGNAEDMKAINEAYRVLGNEATRRAYDLRRRRISNDTVSAVVPPLSPPSTILPDTTSRRFLGALFVLLGGLLFLFLIKIYYIRFMWPLFLLAIVVVFFGVWKLHAAMVFALRRSPVLRAPVWVQESAFWSVACLSAYAVYLLISAI